MVNVTQSYCEGKKDIKVAFVFICPGQEEEKEERPVAGQTGKNLDILLGFLNNSMPEVFPSRNRYEYRILNLSDKSFYKEKKEGNGKTVPLISDIRKESNINRIVHEIGNCEVVVFFNKTSAYDKVMKKIRKKLKTRQTVRVRHLGFQSINKGIKSDKSGEKLIRGEKGNTSKRLEVIAEEIKKELKDYYIQNYKC